MPVNNRFAVLLAEKIGQEKRRISLVEVSRETGIAQRTLQQWHNNKIARYDAPVIYALCKYFKVLPGDLIVIQDNQPAQP